MRDDDSRTCPVCKDVVARLLSEHDGHGTISIDQW
jgi:hypothetical protein